MYRRSVLLLRNLAVRSPPVSVFSTIVARSVCLASRVACACACSGCTVGVLPGPTRVLPMPRQLWHRSQSANSCCAELCCVVVSGGASSTSSCGLSRPYVLLCVLSHPSSTWSRLWPLSILRDTSHHSWLISLADTTDL